VICYTDGSSVLGIASGASVIYVNGEIWNLVSRGIEVPGPSKTNQFAEIFAIKQCIIDTANLGETEVLIRTDSQYAIDCITKSIKLWKMNKNKTKSGKLAKHIEIIEEIHDMMIGRRIFLSKIKSHIGNY